MDEERNLQITHLKQSVLVNCFVAIMLSGLAFLYLFMPRRGGTEPYFRFSDRVSGILLALLVAIPVMTFISSWIWYRLKLKKI
jgi:hypothetical protein